MSRRFSPVVILTSLSLVGQIACQPDDVVAEGDSETTTETTGDGDGDGECGNGIVESNEECDDGNRIPNDDCTNDCTAPLCGDGIVQGGEGCDSGAHNGPGMACNSMCQPNTCGDGEIGPGEGCDDGNQADDDDCSNDCTLPTCGDGFVQPGEECDDDNAVNDDGCTNACTLPACGDDIVQNDETCDDGNDNGANAACTPDCQLANCGDGYVYATGGEECDDANLDDTDGCTNACNAAACGDGIVQAEVDECDDGNTISNDGCSAMCVEQKVIQASAGHFHTCAVLDTGAVRCWGMGALGRLGYANTDNIGDNEHPFSAGDVNVGGLVEQVVTGYDHTCALLEGGTVRCWGYGLYGALGYGSTEDIGDDEHPATAGDVNVGGTVVQLAAARYATCALLETGAVRCWGWGNWGILGYANTNDIGDNEDPASAGDVDVGGVVTQLAAGQNHVCALLVDGSVRCWGYAVDGQLGYGNQNRIGDNETPASAGDVNVGGTVTQIACGDAHTCARLDNGAVRCWGNGGSGGLGYGDSIDIGDNEEPWVVGDVDVGGPVDQLALGSSHSCAIMGSGAVRCWGYNVYGKLGYGHTMNIGDNEYPAAAGDVNVGGSVTQLTTGDDHNCVVLDTGALRCWGRTEAGSLGYGNSNNIGDDELPVTAGNVQVF